MQLDENKNYNKLTVLAKDWTHVACLAVRHSPSDYNVFCIWVRLQNVPNLCMGDFVQFVYVI